ncbi:MAG: ribosome small subunit-dependent GTPase A [Pseudoflavonifractor sp.]|nr:ribosome small subunit-dependent GTPase A [Alloprevotella sp.]MCM1117674.1 ribosome small subunit-dependent GTPase A [Pseudoflavonifractor sp.]
MTGTVIRNTGSAYLVAPDISRPADAIPARIKGNFRIKGIRTTNPVAVGDIVDLSAPGPDGFAFITAIHPRQNYIIRRASNLSKEAHIIASNISRACLIVTLAEPVTSTTFIDRFLATAEAYRIPAIIAINKADILADEPDGPELIEAVASLYRHIGYPVVICSAATGQGIDRLRAELLGQVTLLSGNSGVGKSSLINRLIPGLALKTASISTTHHTGMHTTTFSEMFPLPGGGAIIDTPGVKGFGTIDFNPDEVSHFFPDIFAIAPNCRYGNCTHTHEPGCAVRQAVDDALIARSRYASYLSILDDTRDASKYRKPF